MMVLIVFLFFVAAMLGMAVGLIVGRKPISKTCGFDCECERSR